MKVKNLLGFGLSFVFLLTSSNVIFAENDIDNSTADETETVSNVSLESVSEEGVNAAPESVSEEDLNAAPENDSLERDSEENVNAASESTAKVKSDTDMPYAVEGGNIYYNSEGVITGCDKEVTSANIPESIEGVTIRAIGEYAFSDPEYESSIEPGGGAFLL